MPSQQVTINASAEKVFNYVADIAKHGEWGNPSQKLQVQKTSDGPIGLGSTFASTGQQFGTQHDAVKITEYVPNQRLVYQAEGNAGLIQHSFEIVAAGEGVVVTKTFEALKPKFPLNVLKPVVNGFIQPAALKSDLARIKAKMEAV